MAYLYWVHRNLIHTNSFSEGYIGVTSRELDDRFSEHLKFAPNEHFRNALKKYDDIVVSQLHFGTLEECFIKEREYRPTRFIGWNSCEGGGNPPTVDKDTALKISTTMKKLGIVPYKPGITNSPEAIAKRRDTMKGYRHYYDPISGKTGSFNPENKPDNWILGRKKKSIKNKKIVGVDYGNIKVWIVIEPNGVEHKVRNLKSWCNKRMLNYSRVVGSYGGWKAIKLFYYVRER